MLEIGHLQNSNLYKAAALYELCAATTIPHFSLLFSAIHVIIRSTSNKKCNDEK